MTPQVSLFLSDYFAQADGFLKDVLGLNISHTQTSGYAQAIVKALDLIDPGKASENFSSQKLSLAVLATSFSYDYLLSVEQWDIKKMRTLNESEALALIQKLLKNAPKGALPLPCEQQEQLCAFLLPNYLQKSACWESVKETIGTDFVPQWERIRMSLDKMIIQPEKVENMLKFAGLPTCPEQTTPPLFAMEYRWAVRFSPFVQPSFSLADFIFWMGEDPCAFAAI